MQGWQPTQSIQISELLRKAVDLEHKQVHELALLTTLRDRDVPVELDTLQAGLQGVKSQVETLQRRQQVRGEESTCRS
jgi:hypothetical protein